MVAFLMNIQIKPFLATQRFVAARVKESNLTLPGHRFAAMEWFMIGKEGCAAMGNSMTQHNEFAVIILFM